MNMLEGILFYGGAASFVLGLILIAVFVRTGIFSKNLGRLCVFLIGFGIVIFCIGDAMYDENTLEAEHTEIVITIEDKKVIAHRRHHIRNYSVRHDYFFYFNECEKIEVDYNTYKKYNINDELVIKKTYWYRIDKETGERTLEKITYNE